ncbi:MAG: ester cyclase [Roseiflexaceae bacterium]
MAEAHNAALVRRAVEEIWNRGQIDVADVLFASDYINHAGLIPDLVRGPEAIKISVAFYRTAFPNVQITIDALTVKHDAVLLRWTARSEPAQGTLTGLLVCRCAGGQIAESWAQWDQAGVLKQLGLIQRKRQPGWVPTSAG